MGEKEARQKVVASFLLSDCFPFLPPCSISGEVLKFRSYLEWPKSMGYKRNLMEIILIFIKSSQYYAILYTRGDKKNPAVCAFTTEGFLEQSDMVKCECR